MFKWLSKFTHNPVGVGSVAPSSTSLGRLMARDIQPDWRVLELGPGTGALTVHVLARLRAPEQLTLVESDAEFAQTCQTRFPQSAVNRQNAADFLSDAENKYDAIVSGVPWAALPAGVRLESFALIKKALKPGGLFVMFQYSPLSRSELKKLFGNVRTGFTPWNVPPAFVFTCKKEN